MKDFIEKLIGRLEEISVSRDNDGVINGCNMGICEDDDCLKCLKKKVISIVNQLAEEFATDINVASNGWIPCSERLPDDFMSMEYLTTVKGRFYSEINYYCVVNHKWYSNERTTKEVNVIAWMPKPTVYQPKGE